MVTSVCFSFTIEDEVWSFEIYCRPPTYHVPSLSVVWRWCWGGGRTRAYGVLLGVVSLGVPTERQWIQGCRGSCLTLMEFNTGSLVFYCSKWAYRDSGFSLSFFSSKWRERIFTSFSENNNTTGPSAMPGVVQKKVKWMPAFPSPYSCFLFAIVIWVLIFFPI